MTLIHRTWPRLGLAVLALMVLSMLELFAPTTARAQAAGAVSAGRPFMTYSTTRTRLEIADAMANPGRMNTDPWTYTNIMHARGIEEATSPERLAEFLRSDSVQEIPCEDARVEISGRAVYYMDATSNRDWHTTTSGVCRPGERVLFHPKYGVFASVYCANPIRDDRVRVVALPPPPPLSLRYNGLLFPGNPQEIVIPRCASAIAGAGPVFAGAGFCDAVVKQN